MNTQTFVKEIDDCTSRIDYELTLSETLLSDENTENEFTNYLSKCNIVMLYASCEKFFKFSSIKYLKLLSTIKSANYSHHPLWLINNAKKLHEEKHEESYLTLNTYTSTYDRDKINIFKAKNSEECIPPAMTNYIQTHSLSHHYVRYVCDWLLQVKFQHNDFRTFINNLKTNRHHIVHGNEFFITREGSLEMNTQARKFVSDYKASLFNRIQ